MTPRHNRPIHLLILCGILLLVSIAIGTAMTAFHFRDSALTNGKRELRNTALLLARHLDQKLDTLDLVQKGLIERIRAAGIASSQSYEFQMSGPDVHLMLRDKIAGLPHVAGISLFDSGGKLINFSRSWPLPATGAPSTSIADREYFKALKSDSQLNSLVSEPVRNGANGVWAVVLARKITAPNGEFLGLVLGSIELAVFENFFESVTLGEYSSISLLRRDGLMLARYPRIETAIGQRFAGLVDTLGDADAGVIRLVDKTGGKDRLLAAHRLTHFPLVAVAGIDAVTVLSDWREQTRLLIIISVFSGLVIGFFLFFIVRQLLRGFRSSAKRLTQEKTRLDAAVNNMSQGMLMFDSFKRIAICNQRYIAMYGLSSDVVKPGCTIRELIYHRKETGSFSGDVEQYCADLNIAISEGKTSTIVVNTNDGRAIHIVNQPMSNGGWVATHEDITELRKAERERDRDREFLNQIIDNVPATIIVKDAHTRKYVLINQTGETVFGASRAEIIGKTAYEVWPKTTADVIDEHDEQLLQSGGHLSFDEFALDALGKNSRHVTSKKLVIRDGKGEPQYLLGVIEDVTERKRSNERIAYLAHYDTLTGLPNRVLFREHLEQSLKMVHRGERLALLYLDLDHFKTVNDTLGHPAGDELLKAVAIRLRDCLRETDFVARLGGDEFAIVQSAIADPMDVIDLVNRIHESIREPYEAGGHQLIADTSIGIALAPDDGIEPDQLLKNADLAMYGAKADGRSNYCFFEPAMDIRVKARRALEFDLREAIMCCGFELHYQPIVNLGDNNITGCEVLLRWHHSKRGMISPAEFIPIAEETGLITPLGEWVLRTACAEATTWPDDIKVAVNVSPVQFKSGNFVRTVINALGASRLPASRLELEITESVLIRDDEATLVVLHQLRKLGVRIAMDDFGTGYSSLSYLQRFPFDKIKIDRSFIKDIAEADGTRSIVQAVVSIAAARNITTTGEGVETEQQLEFLRTLGCTEMQGYLFSRPKPAAEIKKLLLPRRERAASVA